LKFINIDTILNKNFTILTDEYRKFAVEKDSCRCCSIYDEYKQVGQSEGSTQNPTFMFVGESLGKDEVEQVRPFIGRAGQRLREELRKYPETFNKKNTLISNALSCRPKDNKFPQTSDVFQLNGSTANGREIVNFCANKWVVQEIKIVNPKILVLVGGMALEVIANIKGITAKSLEDPKIRFQLATIGEYIKAFELVKEVKGLEDEIDLESIDDKKLKEYNDALITARKELVDEDFIQWLNNNPQPLSSSKKLAYVIDKMEGLSRTYMDKSLGAMSEYLYQFVDHTEQEKAKLEVAEEIDRINKTNIPEELKESKIAKIKKKNLVISKEFIHSELKAANADIGLFSLWLDGAAQSDNIILQLIARGIKKQIYSGEKRLIDFQNELGEEYSLFLEGKSQLNVEKLNEEVQEIVQELVFENGEFTTRPRLQYVTELREEDFNLAKAKARRKGFSFKRGAQSANTLNLYKGVTVIFAAYDLGYLINEKATSYMAKQNIDWLYKAILYKYLNINDVLVPAILFK